MIRHIAAARHWRGGRDHSRGFLWLVAARLAGQRRRHRVARRRHAEPPARARLRSRAAGSVRRRGRLRHLERDRGVRRAATARTIFTSRSARVRWCASTSTLSWCSIAISRRAPRSRVDHDRDAGIRDPARSRIAGRDQAGRDVRAAQRAAPTACAASCSAREARRCSWCGRSSTSTAPARSRRAGWHSRARSRRRSSNASDVSRRGRSTGYPVANLDRSGVPEEVRDWVRHSPLTANLMTRVAGRSSRQRLPDPARPGRHAGVAGAARDPAQRVRAGHAHHALPDHPVRPAGRRIHAGRGAAGGALAPPQRGSPVARVALPRHHRAGAGRLAGGRCAHRRDRRRQPGRAAAARIHARRIARALGAVGAARAQRFAGSGDRDAGARRAEPRHRARAVAQGRPPDGRRSELRADRVARPPARVVPDARPVGTKEGAEPAARQPAAPRQARQSRSPDGSAEPAVPAGAPARGHRALPGKRHDARGAVPRPRSLQAHQRLARPRSRRQAAAGNRQARARGGASRGHRRSHGRRRIRRRAAQGQRAG